MIVVNTALSAGSEALGGAESEAGMTVARPAAVAIDYDMGLIVNIELNCAEALGN